MSEVVNNIVRPDRKLSNFNSVPPNHKKNKITTNLCCRNNPSNKFGKFKNISSVDTNSTISGGRKVEFVRVGNSLIRGEQSVLDNMDRFVSNNNINVRRQMSKKMDKLKFGSNHKVANMIRDAHIVIRNEDTKSDNVLKYKYNGLNKGEVETPIVKQQLDENFKNIHARNLPLMGIAPPGSNVDMNILSMGSQQNMISRLASTYGFDKDKLAREFAKRS